MKKFFSVLLSVSLIFTSMTALAAEECEHVNRTQLGISYLAIDRDNACDNGDGTHTGPLCNVTEYTCDDCGSIFKEWSEPFSQKTEYHYFEDGVCGVCGAVKLCNHPEDAQTLLKTGREDEESAAKDNKDGTHTTKYRNYAQYNCNDCDMDYIVYEDWTEITNEAHDWNYETGYCRICGAYNACEHPNLTESEDVKFSRYVYTDNKQHEALGKAYNRYTCTDCGMDDLVYANEYSELQDHVFVDGYCICGACAHENREEMNDYNESDEEGAVDGEDGTCLVPVYKVTQYHCTDCDKTFTVRSEESEFESKPHSFSGGVCTRCGAKNTCEHPEKQQLLLESTRENKNVEDNGDSTHKVKYREHTEYYCAKCGDSYEVVGDWTEDCAERHIWKYEGTCGVCGAENSCEHPNLEESTYDKFYEFYNEDAVGHTAVGETYDRYVCVDCGMDDSVYSDDCEEYLEHNFSNGNCICGACGHINAKPTSRYTWTSNRDAEDNGNGTHTCDVYTCGDYVCTDCGDYFEKVISVEKNVIGKHEFYQGMCSLCGAKNTCEHTGERHTEIRRDCDYNAEPEITEQTHSFPAYLTIYIYCEDCGECVDYTSRDDYPYVAPHCFNDGVCIDCGYTSLCAHTNYREVYCFVSDESFGFAEPIEGTNMHIVKGYIVVSKECLSCGETFSEERTESECTERHTYSRGICDECGIVNTCKHSNITEDEYTSSGTAKDNGDGGHTLTVWKGIITSCGDCGTYFASRVTSEITSVTEEHDYENGVCCHCGHVNTCAHINTKTRIVKEYIALSYDETQHTHYMCEQQQTVCECGEVLASVPIGEAKTVTEAHALYWMDGYMYCDYCNYYKYDPDFTPDYTSMTIFTLPAGLREISSEAFTGTAAQVIIIPENCESIEADAFTGCPNLVYIINHSDAGFNGPVGVQVIYD